MTTVGRIGAAVVMLVVLSAATFAIFGALPGRAADELALEGSGASVRTAEVAPWPVRYAAWVSKALRGDLGNSSAYGRPVLGLVTEGLAYSLVLVLPGLLIGWMVALPLGLWAGTRARRAPDRCVTAFTAGLGAVPDAVIAVLIMSWAVQTGSLRSIGASVDPAVSAWAQPAAIWAALRLPLAALVLVQLPSLVRHIRLSTLTVVQQPFIRHVRAKGLSNARLLWRHVLRAAAPTLSTVLGGTLVSALSTAAVAEVFFSWPGLGALMARAALARDEALIAGSVLVLAAVIVSVNLLSDVAARTLDPRHAERDSGGR